MTNAVFTEPDDQSPWWYHQFLLTWFRDLCLGYSNEDDSGGTSSSASHAMQSHGNGNVGQSTTEKNMWSFFCYALDGQVESLHELGDLEPDAVWVKKNLSVVLRHRAAIPDHLSCGTGSSASAAQELKKVLTGLVDSDPQRSERYSYLIGEKRSS